MKQREEEESLIGVRWFDVMCMCVQMKGNDSSIPYYENLNLGAKCKSVSLKTLNWRM